MEKNPLDDLFQNRLRDLEAAPPAFVWSAVEKAISARRRRRFLTAFWTLGLIGLVGSGAAFWVLKSQKAEAEKVVASSETVAFSAEKAPLEPTAEPSKMTEKAAEKTAISTARPEAFLADLRAKKAGQISAFEAEKGRPDLAFSSKKSSRVLESKAAGEANGFAFEKTALNIESTENELKKDFSNPTGVVETVAKTSFENAAFIKKNTLAVAPLVCLNRLAFVEKTEARPLPKTRVYRAKKRARNCPSFGTRGSAFLLEGWVGPSLALKELRPVLADAPNYANRRAATERGEIAWNAGLRGAFLFHRKFMVRAGLQYAQIHEVFDWREVGYQVWPNSGDTIILYGERLKKTNNVLGFLDLPITIGAELVGGQFGLSLHGGAAANLLFWQRGEVLRPDGQPQKFSKSGIFRANAGLSLLGSAQVFYQIDSKTRLFAEPYFQKIMRPVTVSSYEIEQRYSSSGVQIGLTRLLK